MFFTFVSFFISQAQPGYTLPQLPQGVSLNASFIMTRILTPFANFLIAAGIILAIITIVVSGIMYLKAGGTEANITKAKGWFKNGLIGAVIILGVGVIILTIHNIVVTGTFFGGGAVPGPGIPGGPGPQPIFANVGEACDPNTQCLVGTSCSATGVCVRPNGNLQGEGCNIDTECQSPLTCKSGIFGTGKKTCQNP